MAIRGSRKWTRQPPNGFEVSPDLPNPLAIIRPISDRQQFFPSAALSSSTYSGNASRSFQGELGVYVTGGGIQHTLVAQPDRQIYAVAVRFQQLTTGATQTIFGFNGVDNGTQIRINTSEQLELLAEGSALLATSSSAPFGNTTRIHTLVAVCPSTSGSTFFYLNGMPLLTYAGVVDNKLISKIITLGRRGGAGETLTGVIYEAMFWSGAGNLPTLAQAQEISRDYYGYAFAPRRVGAPISSVATGTVALTGQAATFSAGTLTPNTAVTLSGQSASFTAGTLTPATSVALSGQAATFSAGTVTPNTAVTLSGQAATFSDGTVTVGGDVSVALSGQAATFSAGTITPATSVALSGAEITSAAGTITPSATNDVTVALSGVSAQFYAGTITTVGGVSPSSAGGAGRSRRVKKRYQVEIDGEVFSVESAAEAEQVLQEVKKLAEERAALALQRAEKTNRRRVRKVVQDAKKTLQVPSITVPPDFVGMANDLIGNVESLYKDTLRSIEIAALMRKRQQDEEDDEEVLLLLS